LSGGRKQLSAFAILEDNGLLLPRWIRSFWSQGLVAEGNVAGG
jgi:hypothetical protein